MVISDLIVTSDSLAPVLEALRARLTSAAVCLPPGSPCVILDAVIKVERVDTPWTHPLFSWSLAFVHDFGVLNATLPCHCLTRSSVLNRTILYLPTLFLKTYVFIPWTLSILFTHLWSASHLVCSSQCFPFPAPLIPRQQGRPLHLCVSRLWRVVHILNKVPSSQCACAPKGSKLKRIAGSRGHAISGHQRKRNNRQTVPERENCWGLRRKAWDRLSNSGCWESVECGRRRGRPC